MSINTPIARRGALAIGAAGLLSACVKASVENLMIGDQRGGVQALLEASGLLKDIPYKIQWSNFPNAGPLIEALGAGAIDAGLGGDAPFIFSLQANSGVKAIAASRVKGEPTSLMVPRGSSIRRFDDLLGKRVATPRGSIGHYLMLSGLKRLNKPFDAIDIKFLSPSDGRSALTSGAVDAWAIWDPYAALGELSDAMRVVPVDRSWTPGVGFLFGTDTSLREKRPLLSDLAKRFAAARRWADIHRNDYAKILTRQTGMPIAVTQRYVSRSVYVPTPIDAALIAEEQGIADLFHAAGLLPKPVQVAPHFEPI